MEVQMDELEHYMAPILRARRATNAASAKPKYGKPSVVEASVYWFTLGITLGLTFPGGAERLLSELSPSPDARAKFEADAQQFTRKSVPGDARS